MSTTTPSSVEAAHPPSATVSPAPTAAEAAAIVAAMEALWPRPVLLSAPQEPRNASWRFSGRWWSRPLPMRRDRPYR